MVTYSHPCPPPFKAVTTSPPFLQAKWSHIFIGYPNLTFLPHSSCPSFQHPGQTYLYETNIRSSPKHLFHTSLLRHSSQLPLSLVTLSSSSSFAHSHIHSQPLTSPLLLAWFSSSACLPCVETAPRTLPIPQRHRQTLRYSFKQSRRF